MRNRYRRKKTSLFAHKDRQSPDSQQSKSTLSKAGSLLWGGLRRVCFALGFAVLISIVMGLYTVSQFQKNAAPPTLPDEMVLYLKLDGQVQEIAPQANFMNPFEAVPPTLRQIVETIDGAAADDRIKGLYVRLQDAQFSLSAVQEIRAAIGRLKEAGKFTRIYSSSYGGAEGGLSRLYLASAFEERWMQPLGIVTMAGLKVEMPFFRPVLDKIGVKPEFYQRKAYKNAYESFTDTEMSAANREVLTGVVASVREAVLADMPADLGMDATALERYIDMGLLTAPEALEAGLITHSDYVDVLVDQIKKDIFGYPEADDDLFVHFGSYAADLARKKRGGGDKPTVALVYVDGAIMSSNDSGRDGVASSDRIAPAILDAAEDEDVEAIILRVNSPGGSPVASESILRAVQKAQAEHDKPVIVSMGAMAASGGYWVASSADRIFAMPTTLTGSIGVVGGKISVAQMWDKIGVEWDSSIQWGDNAGMWSLNEGFTAGQQERVEAMLDSVYDAFLARVSEGRGMSLAEAEAAAQGRVWTGKAAVDNGLVDELGGLKDTLAYVADELEVASVDDLQIVQMPRPLTPLERLVKLLSRNGMVFEGLRLQGQLMGAIAPYIDTMAVMNDEAVLAYEPVSLR